MRQYRNLNTIFICNDIKELLLKFLDVQLICIKVIS